MRYGFAINDLTSACGGILFRLMLPLIIVSPRKCTDHRSPDLIEPCFCAR
jgi:hypothetical protein